MAGHKVPTHLDEQNGIGRFSIRTIALLAVLFKVLTELTWPRTPQIGPSLGDLIRLRYPSLGFHEGSFPLLPLAMTLLTIVPFVVLIVGGRRPPPPEHGLAVFLQWLRRRDLVSVDSVAALLGNPRVEGDHVVSDYGFHAAWELPPKNLRLADPADVEASEEQWGRFLGGLSGPICTIVTAHPVSADALVARIERHPSKNAKRLASWLRTELAVHSLIDRHYYLAVFAADETTFIESVGEIAEGLVELKLQKDLIRRLADDELGAVVRRTWSKRKYNRDVTPSGPWTIHSRQVHSDGEWHEVMALSRWPRVIRDNALAPFVDGGYANLDFIQHIAPVSDDVTGGLERKLDGLASSSQAAKRRVAIQDLESFVMAIEGGEEQPFDVSMLLHLHSASRADVKRDAKRIESRVRRITGARAQNVRWEEGDAMLAVSPLAINLLKRRTKRVDTSSVRNAIPYTASAMYPDGAVPWGEALESFRPIGWTRWARPYIPSPHLFVAADSGGGKGFGVKVIESRLLFAQETEEVFGFDQSEDDPILGEYGLFCEYAGIEYRHVRGLDDLDAALRDLHAPGVFWNIAAVPIKDRPEVFLRTKIALWKRAMERRARRSLIVDELWAFVKDAAAQDGADPAIVAQAHAAMEEVARKGRHLWLGVDWMTQRVLDSIRQPIVEVIQSQSDSQLYGKQKPADISKIAPELKWTAAEATAVRHFHPGQFLLVAGPWRVAMHVTASDDEYDMANTDGKVERDDVLSYAPSRDVHGSEPTARAGGGDRHAGVPALALPQLESEAANAAD